MLLILFQEDRAFPAVLVPNPRFSRGLRQRQLVTLLPPRRSLPSNKLGN
jgi:hypothetical protein